MVKFVVALSLLLGTEFSFADLPKNYLSLPAQEKQKALWSEITTTAYDSDELPSSDLDAIFTQILAVLNGDDGLSSLRTTLKHQGDELPDNKLAKFVHPHGTVIKVRYVADRYDQRLGILGEKNVPALIRLSLAAPFDPGLLAFIPGIAIKFLVGDAAGNKELTSLNIMGMYRLEGQGDDTNFFRHPLSSSIPEPVVPSFPLSPRDLIKALSGGLSGLADYSVEMKSKLFTYFALKSLQERFEKAANRKNVTTLPIGHLVSQVADGSVVPNPLAIHHLEFRPTTEASRAYSKSRAEDYRLRLGEIPPKSPLYEVWYFETEKGPGRKAGTLVTEAKAVASSYGDEVLFFRHHPWGKGP